MRGAINLADDPVGAAVPPTCGGAEPVETVVWEEAWAGLGTQGTPALFSACATAVDTTKPLLMSMGLFLRRRLGVDFLEAVALRSSNSVVASLSILSIDSLLCTVRGKSAVAGSK